MADLWGTPSSWKTKKDALFTPTVSTPTVRTPDIQRDISSDVTTTPSTSSAEFIKWKTDIQNYVQQQYDAAVAQYPGVTNLPPPDFNVVNWADPDVASQVMDDYLRSLEKAIIAEPYAPDEGVNIARDLPVYAPPQIVPDPYGDFEGTVGEPPPDLLDTGGDDVSLLGDDGETQDSILAPEGIDYDLTQEEINRLNYWEDIGDNQSIINFWFDKALDQSTAQEENLRETYLDRIGEIFGTMPEFEGLNIEGEGGLQEILSDLRDGPSNADFDRALEYAARAQGYDTVEEYQADLEAGRALDINEMQGMSPEDLAQREQQNRMLTQRMENRARLQAEAILGDTGAMSRALTSLDESNMNIAIAEAQQMQEINTENYARQQAQYKAENDRYLAMAERGAIDFSDYIDIVEKNAYDSAQTWMEASLLTLDAYATETEVISQQAEYIYKMAELDMGLTENQINTSAALFEQAMQPLLTMFEVDSMELAIEQVELAIEAGEWEMVLASISVLLDGAVAINEIVGQDNNEEE